MSIQSWVFHTPSVSGLRADGLHTKIQGGPPYLLGHQHWHWFTTVLCAEPLALHIIQITVLLSTTATQLANLQTTPLWWGSSLEGMGQPTEMKWSGWQRSARTTTFSWTELRPRSLLWISGKRKLTSPHYTIKGTVDMVSISWESISWKTWPVVQTQQSWCRSPIKDLISWKSSGRRTSVKNCCCTSSVSLCYCLCVWFSSNKVTQRNTLQGIINKAHKITGCSPPLFKNCTDPSVLRKPQTFWITPCTQVSLCFNHCPQAGGKGALKQGFANFKSLYYLIIGVGESEMVH